MSQIQIDDIQLNLAVELGTAYKTIKEILSLQPNSIVELDTMANTPLNFLVNGKIVGTCEVVVIDDKFGIRILSINK